MLLRRRRKQYVRAAAGKRLEAVVTQKRGKYSRHRFETHPSSDVALDATLRAAAIRLAAGGGGRLHVAPEDLRRKIRRHRSPYTLVFVVDNSWSVHVERTLETAKGVVLALLKDARINRDRVALITFRHSRRPEATMCLPPTRSYSSAARRLAHIPLTGTTPLPDGMRKAYRILHQTRIQYQNAIPVLVVISDGLPNVSIRPQGDPYEEIRAVCTKLRREGIFTIVVDTEPGGKDGERSNCREMASLTDGSYLKLSELSLEAIEEAVASHLGVVSSPGSGSGARGVSL